MIQHFQIWERVDPENTGYLDRKRFIVALGIVALVQDGHQPVPGMWGGVSYCMRNINTSNIILDILLYYYGCGMYI